MLEQAYQLCTKNIFLFYFYQVRQEECVTIRNYSLKFCKRLLYLVIKIYISTPSINLMNNNLICCGQRSQHLIIYREAIYGLRPHTSLWPDTTTFNKSQRGYMQLETITVCCGHRFLVEVIKKDIFCCDQMLQYLRGHREAICSQGPP